MSCENTNARLQIKYTTITGQVPTIPSTNDHNDGTWNPTDIYVGEFFLNATDDKLWVRTIDGLLPMGGTGGTGSFIGDFVSKANGGTYSGPVFAPTFSAINMISTTISATSVNANIFGSSGSTYYGDGSNLTGITTVWNGGTVSNPSEFNNTVDFNQDISVNNVYAGTLGYTHIHSDVTVDGGLSASYFIGDGSLLTNLPLGPTANYYTTNSYLDGNTIRFDRTDLADAYSVDLTPILFTQSIASFDWNSSLNEATIFINDGSFFTINLNVFSNISTGIINATDVYASNFYGTFNGTFSNDIYTTSATLEGTTAVFNRTDGVTYSLDLSSFSGAGSVGPTGPAGPTGSQGYRAVMNLSYTGSSLTLGLGTITLPIGTPINNLGWQQGTRVRVWHSATEYMEGQITSVIANPQTTGINVNIDYVVGSGSFVAWYVGIAGDLGSGGSGGTQSLAQTLVYGNQTGGTDINLNNGDLIISDDTEKTIGFEEPRIFIQNEYTFPGDNTVTGLLEVKNDVATSQLAHIRTDLVSGDTITTAVQIDETTATILSNNQTTTNEALVRADSGSGTVPQAEVRLYTADFFGNTSYMIMNPGKIEVTGVNSDGFAGIEYTGDYSADYSNRSLVDKEYVDNLAGGETLEQTLVLGNTIGTQSINFGGFANIAANGTNIELKADGNVSGDLYLNSLTVADDTANGIEQISFSSVTGVDRTSNISLAPGQTYEAHTINDAFGTQQTTVIQRQTEKMVELIVDQSTGVDTEYRRELGVIGTTNGSSVKITDNNSLEETQIKTSKSTITLGAKDLSNNDITKVEIKYNDVKISGTGSTFPGAQYDIDYSTNYTNRSLVDKEYVDGAISGGATGLGGVLTIGNETLNNDIILSNSTFTGTSDNIRAFGNTLADAKFSFEDFGSGAWAPTIRVDNGNAQNYITVGDSETIIHNSQTDSFVNTYSQISNGPTQISLSVNDLSSANGTLIDMMSTFISVGSTTPTFQGVEYVSDYSANFTNRTLVDKEYVDNAVAGGGGGGTPSSLSQVLLVGNTASTDIDMNQYQIQNVSVIDADGNVGIHTINMINASLLTLMYNT